MKKTRPSTILDQRMIASEDIPSLIPRAVIMLETQERLRFLARVPFIQITSAGD